VETTWRTQGQYYRAEAGLHWAQYDLDGRRVAIGSDWCCTPTPAELAEWDATAPQIAARWAGRQSLLALPLYIRFGELPRSGHSINHATGQRERGVSCYEAQPDLASGGFVLAGTGLADAAIAAAFGLYGQVALLITGEQCGYGSDGEPVVRKPRILARLVYDLASGAYMAQDVEVQHG